MKPILTVWAIAAVALKASTPASASFAKCMSPPSKVADSNRTVRETRKVGSRMTRGIDRPYLGFVLVLRSLKRSRSHVGREQGKPAEEADGMARLPQGQGLARPPRTACRRSGNSN